MTELKEVTLPKSGRVTEVCREWVVREDSALAHRLQSQEINQHYDNNRYRNQVVRQDFPTALNEQLKEKEDAERQSALYHQMINEQEEADAKIAHELAEKLKRDQDLERRRNMEQSEYLARRLQDNLLVQRTPSSLPSTESVLNELPVPPKNLGMKFNAKRKIFPEQDASTSYTATSPNHVNSEHQLKSNSQLNYVSLELNVAANNQQRLTNYNPTQYTQVIAHHQDPSSIAKGTNAVEPPDSYYEHINLHSHTPEKKNNPQPYVARDYSFPLPPNNLVLPPKPNKLPAASASRQDRYDLINSSKQSVNDRNGLSQSHELSPTNRGLHKLSLDTFDILMGNSRLSDIPDETDNMAIGGQIEPDRNNANKNLNMNQLESANNIRRYNIEDEQSKLSNTDRIKTLQEIGVPADEILEIDRRLTQQEKDEELARHLQEQEGKVLSQEEKDRLVAMEAQDKELARMLQERERAKAKRAKERARLRKQQIQQEQLMQQDSTENVQYTENSPTKHSQAQTQAELDEIDVDSYSNPIDLIVSHENGKPSTGYRPGEYFHSKQSSGASRDSLIYSDESYSNPIDLIKSSSSTSAISALANDDNNIALHKSNKHDIHINRPSHTRSDGTPDGIKNIAATIDPTFKISACGSASMGASMPVVSGVASKHLAHLEYGPGEHNSSPVPPYMPIQGTRRTNGLPQPDKKKKSKDKCTHQ